MASQTQGIQQLLSAEKRAAEKVADARKRKARRLKQAKDQAQEEVEKYRQERERQFKEFEAKHMGSREGVASKIDADTKLKIEEMNRMVVTKQQDIPMMKSKSLGKDQVMLLIELISKHKVLTTRATNATNNKLKEDAWVAIAQEFSAMAGEMRRPDQLRLKWENLKKAARKRNALIRQNNIKVIKDLVELVHNVKPELHENYRLE